MNKQEYESLKRGDKLKIVSLDYTAIGEADFEIGGIVEFVEYLLGSSSRNDILVKKDDGDRWYMSSKDLELVDKQENLTDLVNSPKHYATDPSGVECIQIKRKMSANLGDGADSQLLEDDKSQNKKKPFKSDGGSSPYYFSELPQHVIERIVKKGGIEIKDIIRYCFDNDADCKDIIKALKRIRECKKGGGKEGIDVMYDATKVKFFADEMYESEKANCGQ